MDSSSPPRTRAERAASRLVPDANKRQAAELTSDLNATTASPSRSSPYPSRAHASNVATDVNLPPSDSEIHSTFEDDEYEDESSDEDEEEVDDDVLDPDYNGELYDDDYSDGEESMEKYCVPSARGKGAGRKPNPGHPPKPDTTGMSYAQANRALVSWKQECKQKNDANCRSVAAAAALREFDESIGTCDKIYTGVTTKTLRQMNEVEQAPLQLGHTFPSNKIVMPRIAEEANLFGVRIQVCRSDLFQLQVYGSGGDPFHVHAFHGSAKGMWSVTELSIRVGRTKYIPKKGQSKADFSGEDFAEVVSESDKLINDITAIPENNETFAGDVFEEEGNPDDEINDPSDGAPILKGTGMKTRVKSPIKSRWLVPLIKGALSEKPNISNKELENILMPYVIDKFLPNSLLTMTEKLVRLYLFGNPAENVTYLPQLIRELDIGGHDAEVLVKTKAQLLRKIEDMVLLEFIITTWPIHVYWPSGYNEL